MTGRTPSRVWDSIQEGKDRQFFSNEQMIYELKLLQTLVSSMKAFNLFISLVYFNLQSGCLNNIMNESKIFYIEQILSDKLKSLARESNKWQTYTDRQYGRQSLHWRPRSEKNSDSLPGWWHYRQTDSPTDSQTASQPISVCQLQSCLAIISQVLPTFAYMLTTLSPSSVKPLINEKRSRYFLYIYLPISPDKIFYTVIIITKT